MASGPMRAYILAQHDAVTRWRQLMGPTRVFRARFSAPYSIRGHLGLTDTRNTTHGSDGPCEQSKSTPSLTVAAQIDAILSRRRLYTNPTLVCSPELQDIMYSLSYRFTEMFSDLVIISVRFLKPHDTD
ncbi:nucleoside diphosphate kinase 6-like [Hemitrygon akajei]|uniref:nucleoside diphosphate kinase 6-like n=1 Tax=Hemitrygon akajei TaxID=2704970 RepID=UPI003BF9D386